MSESVSKSQSKDVAPRNIPAAYPGETITRRRLFEASALAAGGIAGAIVGVPGIIFALAPVFHQQPSTWQKIGTIDEFNPDTYVAKVLVLQKDIGLTGKSTVYIRQRNPKIDPSGSPPYIAISTRCTHLGCPIQYVEDAERFVCPCHGGVFNMIGQRVGGPPVRSLDRFNVAVKGNELYIGNRFSLDANLRRFSPRDPGESVNGGWQYIYQRRFTTPPIQQAPPT